MNRDQITGAVKVAAGMAQKKLGDIIGNSRHQACGLSRGFEGRAQMLVGECQALVMSTRGRPKGSYRSAQHEGTPVSTRGRPKGSYRSAQHEGTPVSITLRA